jgi:hypothetical protein
MTIWLPCPAYSLIIIVCTGTLDQEKHTARKTRVVRLINGDDDLLGHVRVHVPTPRLLQDEWH